MILVVAMKAVEQEERKSKLGAVLKIDLGRNCLAHKGE